MNQYIAILLCFGLSMVSMAYIPILSRKLKITYTLPILVVGVLLYQLGVPLQWPEVVWDNKWVKVFTEIIVIISLMGAGLKIGFRYGRDHWKNPLRLIHTTMPLYMVGIFLLAHYLIGMDGPTSLLLAAVCAPTDPVMASELQLEKHGTDAKRNTGMRYVLTAEAGLNDGMAFPFVFMAVLWNDGGGLDLWEWTGYYLLFKILIGAAIGCIFGYLYSWSIKLWGSDRTYSTISGFVAVALAVASFALAEAASGYGFLSAFFTGLFAQYHNHTKKDDHSKKEMVVFIEETEKFLTIIFILLFGGLLANGLLDHSSGMGALVALLIVVVLRPLTGFLGMARSNYGSYEKWAIAFFGIKGIGSFFYLAYALTQSEFRAANELYSITAWVVLVSVVVHGLTGLRAISYFQSNNSD